MKFLCIHIPRRPKSISPDERNPPRPGQLPRRPSFKDRYNTHQQLRRRRSSRLLDHRDAYAPSPVPKRRMSTESSNSNSAGQTQTEASGSKPSASSPEGAGRSANVPKPTSRSPSLRRTSSGPDQGPAFKSKKVATTPVAAVQATEPRLYVSAIVDLAEAHNATTMNWAVWEIEREIRNGEIAESDRLPGLDQVLEKARVLTDKRYLESRKEIRAQLRSCGYELSRKYS